MNNPIVSKTLIEIEENLKNLQTAKKQIETITNSNDALVKEVVLLTKKISVLGDEFSNEKNSFNKQIKTTITGLKNVMEDEGNAIIHNSDTIRKKQTSSIGITLEKLENFQKEISRAEKQIQKLDFEKNFTEVKTEFEGVKNSLQIITTDINTVSEMNKELSQDFSSLSSNLELSLKKHFKEQSKKAFNTQLFLGIGFLIVIVLQYII